MLLPHPWGEQVAQPPQEWLCFQGMSAWRGWWAGCAQALPIALQHKKTYSTEEDTALDAPHWGFCDHKVFCELNGKYIYIFNELTKILYRILSCIKLREEMQELFIATQYVFASLKGGRASKLIWPSCVWALVLGKIFQLIWPHKWNVFPQLLNLLTRNQLRHTYIPLVTERVGLLFQQRLVCCSV